MPKMIILRGISGSGKSTFARQYADATDAVIVSRDALRVAFFGSDGPDYYDVPKGTLTYRENVITKMQDAAIVAALRGDHDVIIDNTNVEMKFVNALAKLGRSHGAEVEVKVFDVSLKEASDRVLHRAIRGGRPVDYHVIKRQHDRFQGSKNKPLPEFREVKPYEGSVGRPDAFMFDLDGTVYHMNGKRGPYAGNVDVDDPDEAVQEIVRRLIASGLPGIAMSGRKEHTRELTEKCLERDGIPYEELFMRADDDNRSDDLVKADLFDDNVRDYYNVLFVIDDRAQVVRMWQRMGLKVLNVAGADGGEF